MTQTWTNMLAHRWEAHGNSVQRYLLSMKKYLDYHLAHIYHNTISAKGRKPVSNVIEIQQHSLPIQVGLLRVYVYMAKTGQEVTRLVGHLQCVVPGTSKLLESSFTMVFGFHKNTMPDPDGHQNKTRFPVILIVYLTDASITRTKLIWRHVNGSYLEPHPMPSRSQMKLVQVTLRTRSALVGNWYKRAVKYIIKCWGNTVTQNWYRKLVQQSTGNELHYSCDKFSFSQNDESSLGVPSPIRVK